LIGYRPIVLLFFLAGFACAEEAPVTVNVYFSKDDQHWAGVEKLIDTVAAKYKRLRVSKIDIDTPVGYKLLHFMEQQAPGEPGDLTVSVDHIILADKGERREIESSFVTVVERVLGLSDIKGKKPADAAAYAREIFGKDATVIAQSEKVGAEQDSNYFRVRVQDKDVGWVVNAYRAIDCPVCSDSQFLLAVKSPELTVMDMRPVRELEIRGVKADDAMAAKFVSQFKGRAAREGEKRADTLSGATKTTFAYQIAMNEVLQELQKREKK
jgi:hypothetical protein